MKGSNSRLSHRASARYSNIAQVQGGMITDADLTEAGQLHQARDQALGRVTVGAGVPAAGGMVKLGADGIPALQAGEVVAGGQVGRFEMTGTPATLSAQLAAQVDLPNGPVLGNGPVLLYADVWDRPVFALQDPYLADAGLHGAQTSYRTRRMVQIKALPLADTNPAPGLAALDAGTFPFAAKGNALASITARNVVVAQDLCDPCATEVQVSQTLPNALFRIEVIGVTRSSAGTATAITLAWSLENAEALELVANLSDLTSRDAFARDPAVYEFFSETTEAQIGAFAAGFAAKRPTLSADLFPVPAGAPAFTHVRRWDGAATVALSGAVTAALGSGVVTRAGATISLAHEFFTLTLDFTGAEVLAGDFWLVELRRYAPEAEQLRLVGAVAGKALPSGVEHAFCPLFVTRGNAALAPPDALRRKISMPPLADIPADHVSYDPACPDWYGPVDTVQDALDALCNLPASKVVYTPKDGCERFAGTGTVAEALDRLCTVEDNSALTLVLRSMMDWGVVCGLRLSIPASGKRSVIAWSAGVALDPAGRIVSVPAGNIDLNREQIKGLEDARDIQRQDGEVCFALSFNADGTVQPYLVDAKTALPADPTRDQAIATCAKPKKGLQAGVTLAALTAAQDKALRKVNTVWARHDTLKGAVGLTAGEAGEIDKVAAGLLRDYAALISASEAEEISAIWKRADEEYATAGLAAAPAEKRRMQRAVAKIAAVAEYERRFLVDCECVTALTPCPPAAADPALVPLGCVVFETFDPGRIILAKLCPFCCRKQAMTWRANRYYQGSFFDGFLPEMEDRCCWQKAPPNQGGLGPVLEDWYREVPPKVVVPPLPEIEFRWPPRKGRPIPGGGFTDPVPDYIRPDLGRFGEKDAIDILTGKGLEVAQVLDLDNAQGGLDAIFDLANKEGSPKEFDAIPAVGDKVVLITRGGQALDFVTIGAGAGRFQYPTQSDTKAMDAQISKTVDAAVRSAVKAQLPPRAATGVDTGAIADSLQELAAVKAGLEAQIATLGSSREALTRDLGALKGELTALEAQRTATAAGLDALKRGQLAAQEGLAALQKAQGEVLRDVRVSQPLESLKFAPDVTQRLKAAGVVTVKDIEDLPPALLSRALSGTQLNAAGVKDAIEAFVRPR